MTKSVETCRGECDNLSSNCAFVGSLYKIKRKYMVFKIQHTVKQGNDFVFLTNRVNLSEKPSVIACNVFLFKKVLSGNLLQQKLPSNVCVYTGCPGRNVPDFGRMFLKIKYTDITQNAYIQSWTVAEIMAREVWKYDSCYTLIDYQIRIKTGRNMWFL